MRITVFGGGGFIGGAVAQLLQSNGYHPRIVARGDRVDSGQDLGHVVYAAGLTGDFRSRTADTIEAHAAYLARIMAVASYESWLYLSSTRVYSNMGIGSVAREELQVPVLPSADSVYDLSKLTGEAIVLGTGHRAARVARISNVYGRGMSRHTFLGSILGDLETSDVVTVHEAPSSSKDYVAIDQVAIALERIMFEGQERMYNVCSGIATSHRDIAKVIERTTDKSLVFASNAPVRSYPTCSNERLVDELGFDSRPLLDDLPWLLRRDEVVA